VVEWIIEVSDKFRLLPETVFIATMTIDKYLGNCKEEVKKSDVQGLAIASLLISTKYEEIYPPSLKDMIRISGDSSLCK
jgi:hypothetical protein